MSSPWTFKFCFLEHAVEGILAVPTSWLKLGTLGEMKALTAP